MRHVELFGADAFAFEPVLDLVDLFGGNGDDRSDRAVDNADMQLLAAESGSDLGRRGGYCQEEAQLVGRSANPVPRDIDLEEGGKVDGA